MSAVPHACTPGGTAHGNRGVCVRFLPSGRSAVVPAGSSLLVAARQAGEPLVAPCGGAGTCGSCLIRISEGVEHTQQMQQPDAGPTSVGIGLGMWERGFRPACRTITTGDVTAWVPAFSRLERQVVLKAPRRTRFPMLEPVRTGGGLGLALDVGSTTVAAYLCDMGTGDLLAWGSMINPQASFGEDIMTRVQRAVLEPESAVRMHRLIIGTADGLLRDLCRQTDRDPSRVTDVVVVGNPVMHHLFFNLDLSPLSRAPFRPEVRGAMVLSAGDIGLEAAAQALVYAPPLEDGFVGSDNVAAIVASDLDRRSGRTLLLDLGTNGELALASGASCISTSCATGPSFEGAHITYGTRAVPGAIERVGIDPLTWEPSVEVLNDPEEPAALPVGLCGSGVIDAVAALLDSGIIAPNGRFTVRSHSRVRRGAQGAEYVLVWSHESGLGEDLTICARDVRAVQLAVAAVRAGTNALLRRLGPGLDDINHVLIAGAFGSRLSVASAVRLGLLPPVDERRVTFVGNAAGEGACLLLVDHACRRRAEELARNVEHLDLTQDPDFAADFVRFLRFPG